MNGSSHVWSAVISLRRPETKVVPFGSVTVTLLVTFRLSPICARRMPTNAVHQPLDVLDHDDRVVDHDADCEDQTK